jgi:hypothetical protein
MTEKSKNISCENCKWFKAGNAFSVNLNRGDCRLMAPIPNSENGMAMWPHVGQWDFCGDFTARSVGRKEGAENLLDTKYLNPDDHESSTFEPRAKSQASRESAGEAGG